MRFPLRRILSVAAVFVFVGCAPRKHISPSASPCSTGLIVFNAAVTTQDESQPGAQAFAVRDGKFIAVGTDDAVISLRQTCTLAIDAKGRRVIPGLNDSHLHAVRGGRFYNAELRWDGVPTLRRGLEMIREQAVRTPRGQWVRVIGGWTPYQFTEKRLPTVAELNKAAPDTPVFVLFLYSRGFLNRAGVQALGLTPATKPPPGSRYELVEGGAILHVEPNPTILYKTVNALPALSPDEQINSTRHFYRELNRFGLTSAVDAGSGGHQFPENYEATKALALQGQLPIRISFNLFPQQPGNELDEFERWTRDYEPATNLDTAHEHGYELEGAGESLVASAGDFENFMSPRPEFGARYKEELGKVAFSSQRVGHSVFMPPTTSRSPRSWMCSNPFLNNIIFGADG